MASLNKQDIAIGVPIYKTQLSNEELFVLNQGLKILKEYPFYFIAPDNLDQEYYKRIVPKAQFITFSKGFFESTVSYSQLMTRPAFYRAFSAHRYLLIYQTDAYVFRDELMLWANKGYDYIGAPWIDKSPQTKQRIWIDLNRFTLGKVGNGGFCLRKIESHIHISQKWGWIQNLLRKNEDFFWSVLAPKLNRTFKIPTAKEAISFSFELAPSKAYEMNGKQLPFGCHAWQKYDPAFWSNHIPFEP